MIQLSQPTEIRLGGNHQKDVAQDSSPCLLILTCNPILMGARSVGNHH